MSKGSSSRPFSVSAEDFSAKWEATFGRKANVDNVQKKTSGPDGSIEATAKQERGNDSSGDSTVSADDKPAQ